MKHLKIKIRILALIVGMTFINCSCLSDQSLPKGLMLNLDFQQIKDGLIPSKTLYPLYVPLGDLGTDTFNNRTMLTFQEGQGLDIPHSSLLDPDGDAWVVIVRFFASSNGIILSQGNDDKGYVLYLKDGNLHAAIRSGHTTVTMKGTAESGTDDCLDDFVTAELRIKDGFARLSINHDWIDLVQLDGAFTGSNYKIRMGQHAEIPTPFKQIKPVPPTGFTGAISSLKMLRQ
jgi:hypothetical protein